MKPFFSFIPAVFLPALLFLSGAYFLCRLCRYFLPGRLFPALRRGARTGAGALSLALAQAGCPVLSLSAETMSLEDVFLQLTETPESGKPESAAAPAENPPAEAAAEEENEKEADSDESNL